MPPSWRSEFLSVLVTTVAAKALSEAQAAVTWQRALALLRGRERDPDGGEVIRTALTLGVSAYDAHFMALAEALDVQLVTGDRCILRAGGAHAISIEAFAGKA